MVLVKDLHARYRIESRCPDFDSGVRSILSLEGITGERTTIVLSRSLAGFWRRDRSVARGIATFGIAELSSADAGSRTRAK
jgi:hypothetical protein